MRKLFALTLIILFDFSLQACAQELQPEVGDQSPKLKDISQKNQFFVEEKNRETLSPPMEDIVILNGCMPGMSAETIKEQFGPEVKIGSLDFCGSEEKDKVDGQIYLFSYGQGNGRAGDPLLCVGHGCPVFGDVLRGKFRYYPFFLKRQYSLGKYLSQKIKRYFELLPSRFVSISQPVNNVDGYYLRNHANKIVNMICFIYARHSNKEKSRLLGECYQRWVERKAPKSWINHNGVSSRIDSKKY